MRMVAARESVITNSVITEMIDWYNVLKDIPALTNIVDQKSKSLAVV